MQYPADVSGCQNWAEHRALVNLFRALGTNTRCVMNVLVPVRELISLNYIIFVCLMPLGALVRIWDPAKEFWYSLCRQHCLDISPPWPNNRENRDTVYSRPLLNLYLWFLRCLTNRRAWSPAKNVSGYCLFVYDKKFIWTPNFILNNCWLCC